MAATPEKSTNKIGNNRTATVESNPRLTKIDPTAPAGSENSLGAESVRDGRPDTDDGTVEAMDEEGPAIPPALANDNTGTGH
jgi:hypothetical protein